MIQPDTLNVSRETSQRLAHFAALIEKWNPKINLVSKRSLPDIWQRHIVDSVQLHQAFPGTGKWVDIGSGGGFPGLIVAIMRQGMPASDDTLLIESDQRKCAFLRTAVRELDLNCTVLSQRIETASPQCADVLSARALADLDQLLGFADRHLNQNGTALFPKGATWKEEHSSAQKQWSYDCDVIQSKTNPKAAILKVRNISRV